MEFLLDPFNTLVIPFGDWVNAALDWLVTNFRWFFQLIKMPVKWLLQNLELILRSIPQTFMIITFGLFGWQIAGRRVGILAAVCMSTIGLIGAWPEAMTTIAIVFTAIIICSVVGIPLGLLASQSERFESIIRPTMDLMQTTPSFVYLVPVVMLFGIGNVAGIIVTIIYAMPPVVRLTNLGIRQVGADEVEAAYAFGATRSQVLRKIQIPLAMPTIMAGVNQTVMMALAMSVVASMISVTGLGQLVLLGIGRLDMGVAAIGGVGIVLLAITIDRVSQGFGLTVRDRGHRRWYEVGPIGKLYKLKQKFGE